MEIVLIIVGIVVLLWVIGGLDNNRPVQRWSDEKLERMRGKLLHAARTAREAGNLDQASVRLSKAEEVLQEVRRRKERQSQDNFKGKVNEIVSMANSPEMRPVLADMGIKMGEIYHAVQNKYQLGKSESHRKVDKEIEEIEKKFLSLGFDEDAAAIQSINEVHKKYVVDIGNLMAIQTVGTETEEKGVNLDLKSDAEISDLGYLRKDFVFFAEGMEVDVVAAVDYNGVGPLGEEGKKTVNIIYSIDEIEAGGGLNIEYVSTERAIEALKALSAEMLGVLLSADVSEKISEKSS